MRPPFAYFGGKTRLAEQIVAQLPPHEHYVEPFAGSLAVLLAKPRSRMETVNDLDGDLMTFWRVLREQPDDLTRVCALTPHARAEQLEAYALGAEVDDLERARRVWVLLSQGRGGQMRPTGWRHYVDPAGSVFGMPGYLEAYVSRLEPAAARLAGVSLECQPALDIIDRYGRSPNVLLYVDPPYLGSTRVSGGYRHEMKTEAQHRELADALRGCAASVVLSGYDSPLYADLYDGWHVTRIDTTTGQGGTRQERTEVLWSNRTPEPTLFEVMPA
ncbi:DNA adenine methylase [Prauserella endophytica]|uniref:DNA adenine methylase n=1 Tax=Prauserella endophytica TaxID=1592324 RepID=A0ABY2S0A9_9PSEU|nr:DNA adenine methylase [Prauserella endophytica]PXY20345.1 DNA methyltransferase [Prauserella coralliicola]TKG66947.1 DNA adenine methylase [Prauserella endophytica]